MLTKDTYLKWSRPFREKPKLKQLLVWTDRVVIMLTYVSYILFIILLTVRRDPWLIRFLAVPAGAFVLMSLFRAVNNAPRPYEIWDIQPLLKKDTKGRSFPSRHCFSIAILAAAIGSVHLPAGIVLLVGTAVLCWERVTAGVHFPRDVIAGAAIGLGVGVVAFYLI